MSDHTEFRLGVLAALGAVALLSSACSGIQMNSNTQGATAPTQVAMVDCSEARFQSGNSTRSLMGWSDYQFKQVTEDTVERETHCEKLLSFRGDAHCQELDNRDFRSALAEALELCP